MEQLLEKVRLLHIQNDFKNNGGEDKYFRMALLMEELGEICDALTKQKPNFKEEHADLLILLLGNCVAYDIDIIKLTSEKLDRLLKMKARTDGNGHSRLITELEEKNIIITGGGTGIPNSATHGALAVNGISIAYSNEGHCEGGHEPATFRVATEMGWDGRSVLAVKSSDLLIVIGGCNGTLNEITLAYLNNIPIWVLEDSSEMICRLKNFLYEGKYIDKRKNVEIEFFNSAQSMIEKLNSKNILQN